MICPKCSYSNPRETKFCDACHTMLVPTCPVCGNVNPFGSRFCNQCGGVLDTSAVSTEGTMVVDRERKLVTVLFSDLCEYTEMTEKLDPEEVKEIMGLIFGEIAQLVSKYEGFIERFIGDAVMVLFGIPNSHEDDPIRAIQTAREIHQKVEALTPKLGKTIGREFKMHTGIHTGLVVTGDLNLKRGTHGIMGETINIASRLQKKAKAGEILVSLDTFQHTQGRFKFERQNPISVKGKSQPIHYLKVLSTERLPSTRHRLAGISADLIGRQPEIDQLEDALRCLLAGKGTVMIVTGDSGAGKTRLIEEFKAALYLQSVRWLESNAYAYTHNMPYFPILDLLSRIFKVEEVKRLDDLRRKIETGVEVLIGDKGKITPAIGRLFSIPYPGIEDISPELWQSLLFEAVRDILAAISKKSPTIVCIEDLHWADSSTLELLKTLLEMQSPQQMFICTYRPNVNPQTDQQFVKTGTSIRHIHLKELSPNDTRQMVLSLLKTDDITPELLQFVTDKAGGNPFYVEELVNALIESGILSMENHQWQLSEQITASEIPPTVQGVISARLDRLDKFAKRLVREASVIGRIFVYRILKSVTDIEGDIRKPLNDLEHFNLIRKMKTLPEIEYIFKHALTQEVAYNGLLKREREIIHERIGSVIEQLFQERLPEFYETLAFHFSRSKSLRKAIHYSVKSGDKSLERYALDEAHRNYSQAFEILKRKRLDSEDEKSLLLEILIKWAFILYYLGDFNSFINLFSAHEKMAESSGNEALNGMYNAWYGFALCMTGNLEESYQKLIKSLKIGEAIGDRKVIGYACTWLVWTCWDSGRLSEAMAFGDRAQAISKEFSSDHYMYFKSLAGIGQTCYSIGKVKKALWVGSTIFDYGVKHSNARSMTLGYICSANGHLAAGDISDAIVFSQKAVDVSRDPFYSHYAKLLFGFCHLMNEEFDQAETALTEVLNYSRRWGANILGVYATAFLGAVYIAAGNSSTGMAMIRRSIRVAETNQRKTVQAILEYTLGKIFVQLAIPQKRPGLKYLVKNIGFLLKNIPFAGKKAEKHLRATIALARSIGAEGILGQALFDLGSYYREKAKNSQSKECLEEAARIFSKTGSVSFRRRAEALLSFPKRIG